MKSQCDEKRYGIFSEYTHNFYIVDMDFEVLIFLFRELYEFMLNAQKERGRSKGAKGDTGASEQLKQAQEDYQEEATLFLFRLKSLKQGQFRSLFTQAARHHAAQVHIQSLGEFSLSLWQSVQKFILCNINVLCKPAKFVQKGAQVP